MPVTLTRRCFLAQSAFVGCSMAASPLVTPITLASTPGDHRLVVILLRGGMDGIDVVRPLGDDDYGQLRKGRSADSLPLDDFYALHPALGSLIPLWRAGELGFAHAVSTPYRDKRSHFDGQDLLEAGTVAMSPASDRDGWLNRLLTIVPRAEAETAFALGNEDLLILKGVAPKTQWSPGADFTLSPQALQLAEGIMAGDPEFAAAFSTALSLADADGDTVEMDQTPTRQMLREMGPRRSGKAHIRIARFAGERLAQDTRVAAFSLSGWDTHRNQQYQIGRALERLSETILTLREASGTAAWERMAILAMTEFGRTARINGSLGTDHGTGGVMLLAGGAINGGRVMGMWPGLDEASLYQGRDLMPTADVRAYAAWAMRGLFGVGQRALEQTIFPGLDLGNNPGVIA